MLFVGFLPPRDPRILSTVDRIERELGDGCFLRRCLAEETPDGLSAREGAFTILTFWLISALLFAGQTDRAGECFEKILSYASSLGLFSEMIDASTGEFLANYPQAFSHIGLIHAARNLTLVDRHGWLPPHQVIPGHGAVVPGMGLPESSPGHNDNQAAD